MDVLRTHESRFLNLKDYPFQSHYLELDGIRMHYLDEGPDDSMVILLLHGVPTWSYLYRKMIHPLVLAGLRVIAPDLAGFGKSDKPLDPDWHSLTNHTDVIIQFVTELKLKNITLFGQDWGSMIGLRAAMQDQDRYSGIIISNGGLPTGSEKKPVAFKLWSLFTRFSPFLPIGSIVNAGSKTNLSSRIKKAYRAPFPGSQYKKGIRFLPHKMPIGRDNQEIRANINAWEQLAKWTKPFLTVYGDADPITRGWDKKFQMHIPGAQNQKHQLLKAGHFIQEDAALGLAEIIITFIRNNASLNTKGLNDEKEG